MRGVGRGAMVPAGPRVLISGVALAVPTPRTSSAGAAMVAMAAPMVAVRAVVRVWVVVVMLCSLLVVAALGWAALRGMSAQPACGAHFFGKRICCDASASGVVRSVWVGHVEAEGVAVAQRADAEIR